MAAAAEHKLTKEEFHARYDGEKPYFEYWNGEAVQKVAPKSVHALVQKLLCRLLDELGLESASELELRIDPDYELVPDVIAVEGFLEQPYPTKPFEVVIEILSPGDQFSRVLRKCRLYEKWSIRQIVVVDPQNLIVWRFENGAPAETDVIALRGEARLLSATLWELLEVRIRETR